MVTLDRKESEAKSVSAVKVEDKYPDLYLPVQGNYNISNKFYGYMDSLSADNNLMIFVELSGLSYRYGTTIYAVDRINGAMYGTFSVGFRVINERATTESQYGVLLLMVLWACTSMHASTLPGMTQMVTPLAESTPIIQSSQMPTIPGTMPPVSDILEPTSNEQARSNYLERK